MSTAYSVREDQQIAAIKKAASRPPMGEGVLHRHLSLDARKSPFAVPVLALSNAFHAGFRACLKHKHAFKKIKHLLNPRQTHSIFIFISNTYNLLDIQNFE